MRRQPLAKKGANARCSFVRATLCEHCTNALNKGKAPGSLDPRTLGSHGSTRKRHVCSTKNTIRREHAQCVQYT